MYSVFDKERLQEEDKDDDAGRSCFRRDFARLLHSSSFRRLQGKTQLFPGHESDFFRNRLTHSLEVAQIAKGIAQKLNLQGPFKNNPIDLDLVEFAGLAHDLGHPPFGHNGEKALDDCMKNFGGFEGNAQTLRILSRVEKKVYRRSEGIKDEISGISEDGKDLRLGLNLSFRSLASILKYDRLIPLQREKGSDLNKGYYNEEKKLVRKIKKKVGGDIEFNGDFKTIECQIMDIADDIAYSTYDLEDAMKGGFMHPLKLFDKIADDRIFKELSKKVRDSVPDVTFAEIYDAAVRTISYDKNTSADIAYKNSKLIASDGRYRTAMSSEIVGKFMQGIYVSKEVGAANCFTEIKVERDTKIAIETLKHLNFLLTIMSPSLKVVEYRGYEVVQALFNTFSSKNGFHLLPDDVQSMYLKVGKESFRMRLICDFVSGMTDRYALEMYERLKGSGASIFKPL